MPSSMQLGEEDMKPLVQTTGAISGTAKGSLFHRRWRLAALLFVISLATFLTFRKTSSSFTDKVMKAKKSCPKYCASHLELHREKWGGNLMETEEMIALAEEEREKLVARLKVDYGEEYYPRFFLDENGESIGRTGFVGANETSTISRSRYIRKLMMKILSVQLAVKEERGAVSGCDCSTPKTRKRNLQGSHVNEKHSSVSPNDDYYARFVWVNGGHSSAAGHGNLFSETYTAVMERSAKDVFAAVGIDLEGRNYGMGGFNSAPQLALCTEAIYGVDADLITWNFGMTDSFWFWRNYLYGNQRGMHRNRPLLLDIDIGTDNGQKHRANVLKDLENAGLASMYMNVNYFYDHQSKGFIPDMQNMTQSEIDAVPEFLRYFKCGEGLEKGEPLCEDKKYSDECTPDKAPWHPGWKANALNGNILALFMVDLLIDALKTLSTTEIESVDRESMLSQLRQDEDADYEHFFRSNIPDLETVKGLWNENITEDLSLLFRHRTLCHTAILPAETRYRGILTEMHNSSFDNFDIGMKRSKANKRPSTDKSTMQLVYDERDDEPCGSRQVAIDHQDYFLTTYASGKSSLTIPNMAEKETYLADGHEIHGLVVICFMRCPWKRCPDGDMKKEDFFNGNATLWVNDNPVTGMVDTVEWGECALLRGEQGYVWKANDQGQYEFMAQVNHPGKYIRISSFILI